MVGIFQFMAELYRQRIFNDKIIEKYIKKLLEDIKNQSTLQNKLIELECECLCKFISTLSYNRFYNLILCDIKSFSQQTKKFPSRIRFMFLDLLDNMKKKKSSNRFAK